MSGRKINIKGDYESRAIWFDGELLDAEESIKVINHSPDGFAWGYRGSGPSQLALGILLKVCDTSQALSLYHLFKEDFISSLPHSDFNIDIEIDEWINKKYANSIYDKCNVEKSSN